MNSCAVIIPIYKPFLTNSEKTNIKISILNLEGFEIFFMTFKNLNVDYYKNQFKSINYIYFDDAYFKSISDYSRLMLSQNLYESFSKFSHILICQTDAIALKPELSYWLNQPYDYIGAPWPNGFEYTLYDDFPHVNGGVKSKAFVGNGGFSLRNINACLNLFEEFPLTRKEWIEFGHAEDLFFGFTSSLSKKFRIPNIMVAALFSHETQSHYLYNLTGSVTPFGCHAYETHAPEIWKEIISSS